MVQILELILSYYRFRSAVLRNLPTGRTSKLAFSKLSGLCGESKYRRQIKPDLWKPLEIKRLAVGLGLSEEPVNKLTYLAPLIVNLPKSEKKLICKTCFLKEDKLLDRLRDADSWQPQELDRLKYLLETKASLCE